MFDTGECEKEIKELCSDIEQGDGELAECMSDAIAEVENAEGGGCPGWCVISARLECVQVERSGMMLVMPTYLGLVHGKSYPLFVALP